MRPNQTPPPKAPSDPSLTSAQFHILLALATGDRHGYGIMQEIKARTEGAVELGPGTLYRSIKQLLTRGFILEVPGEFQNASRAERRRRSYALTPAGKKEMAEEAQRLRDLVRWAEEEMVLEGRG